MNPSLWMSVIALAALIVFLGLRRRRKHRQAAKSPRGLSVHLTTHVSQRMRERGVTRQEIHTVLAAPDRYLRDSAERSVRLERDFGDRILKVWVAEPWPATKEIVVKSTAWQHTTSLAIPIERIGRLVGRGGANIGRLRTETGAHIHVDDDGTVRITGDSQHIVALARQRVAEFVAEAETSGKR